MKIIVIGATGTIGSAVHTLMSDEHQIIAASRSSELEVDLQKPESLQNIFNQHPDLDAIFCVAGDAAFGQLDKLSDEDVLYGINNKLLGQVHLVRLARKFMKDDGILVLTTGVLAQHPNPYSSMVTMINRGLEGFVEAASLDMPGSQKLHAVSPPMAKETAEKLGWGPGGVPAIEIARLYQDALESSEQGRVFSYL